ncbi:hypothetical protein Q5P01_000740 [Channa striata]|uniref:Uncharacterized protein n=1 Tax=Channa striata TaxID=64152 RepID=A0AA88IYT5_CHASR|nr:hypothetical protein Q5P01_000740 [Channa striata]
MSLLPYVSMPRIYRASLLPQDEAQFRAACLKLALGVLTPARTRHPHRIGQLSERHDSPVLQWGPSGRGRVDEADVDRGRRCETREPTRATERGVARSGLENQKPPGRQREPRSRAHTQVLNSHLSQGSQESTCAETSIQRTRTFRDEDLPSVGGRDPGARIRWEIADNLVLTSREIAYYDMQMDEEAERTTASSGSVLTAGGMSLEGEEDLCSSDINPFFSRTSAVNRTPDTDVLQRAVEMYLPEGIPREVEEMYQEYHRTWSPDRSGSVDEAYRGESRTSASERSATSVSGSIFGDRASSERFRSERPSATGARVLDEPSLEEPPPGPDRAELIEGGMPDDRPGPSRGDRDQQAEPLSDSDLGNEAQRARISRANRMRWKSRGLTTEEREASNRARFHKMKYLVSEDIRTLRKPPLVRRVHASRDYVSHPSQGLPKPRRAGIWDEQDTRGPGDVVILDLVSSENVPTASQWARGAENSSGRGGSRRNLTWPAGLAYDAAVNCKTLSCWTAEQAYHTLNLSAPPHGGFSHTEIVIDSLPSLCRDDAPHLIALHAKQTNYLGAVCTAQNVSGLILHRIHADHRTLVNVLDMHTCLQVHSFVPRTFALHCVMDEEASDAVGVFVGESPGSLNLGQSSYVVSTSYDDTITLAFHVLRCLLRVQILSTKVLGFAMRCVQPARIWRTDDGFRVDMLGCLTDTLYAWDKHRLASRNPLVTIWETLTQLRVHKYVPRVIADELQSDRAAQSLAESEELLLRVYRLCDFPDSSASNWDAWDVLGTNGAYSDFSLPIQDHRVHPYGPFFVKIQNQIIKWNRAIVVEPLSSGVAMVGQLNRESDLAEDVLTRALVDTFASNPYPESRREEEVSEARDEVREASEALRRAAESDEEGSEQRGEVREASEALRRAAESDEEGSEQRGEVTEASEALRRAAESDEEGSEQRGEVREASEALRPAAEIDDWQCHSAYYTFYG